MGLTNFVCPEKNGRIMMCVNFTEVNKITPIDQFVFPNRDHLIQNVGHLKPRLFSTIDLGNGLHQTQIYPLDRTQNIIYYCGAEDAVSLLVVWMHKRTHHLSKVASKKSWEKKFRPVVYKFTSMSLFLNTQRKNTMLSSKAPLIN